MPKRIAILDDDAEFAAMLQHVLEGSGHEAVAYARVGKLLDAVLRKAPDLLVIDVNLGGVDGREVVRILRSNPDVRRMPVIVVSGTKVEPSEVVKGFNDGADEYLIKPFELEHFLIRAESLMKRADETGARPPAETFEIGNLKMCEAEYRVTVAGDPIRFTRLEFELLRYFLTHPGRVMTRALLLEEVWKLPMETTTRTVDRFVNHLRVKLKGFTGGTIDTMVNIGYMFSPNHKSPPSS